MSHYFVIISSLKLNHGADPTIKNQEGQTPYDLTTADDVKSLIEAAMPQHNFNLSAVNSSGGASSANTNEQLSSQAKTAGYVCPRIQH